MLTQSHREKAYNSLQDFWKSLNFGDFFKYTASGATQEKQKGTTNKLRPEQFIKKLITDTAPKEDNFMDKLKRQLNTAVDWVEDKFNNVTQGVSNFFSPSPVTRTQDIGKTSKNNHQEYSNPDTQKCSGISCSLNKLGLPVGLDSLPDYLSDGLKNIKNCLKTLPAISQSKLGGLFQNAANGVPQNTLESPQHELTFQPIKATP